MPGSRTAFDVAVIGGGLAGLSAARALLRRGHRVVVLEALARPGGRLVTVHPGRGCAAPVELGAEFVHGRPRALLALLRRAGIPVCRADGRSLRLERRAAGAPLIDGERNWQEIERAFAALAERGPRDPDPDLSFAAFARTLPERRRRAATEFVEGFEAAAAARVSALSLRPPGPGTGRRAAGARSAAESAGESSRIPSGYGSLVRWLVRDIGRRGGDIRTGVRVRELAWRRHRVVLRSDGPAAPLVARRALLAVAVGALQSGSPALDPPVPAKAAAAAALEMSQVVKVVLELDLPLGRMEGLRRAPAGGSRSPYSDVAYLFAPAAPFPTWWTSHPIDSALMVGWAGNGKAAALHGLDGAAVRAAAIESLAAILGLEPAALAGRVRRLWLRDWSRDELTRGAYAFVPVGAMGALDRLGEPVADTLFYAGDVLGAGPLRSTAGGAVASGLAAARALTRSLR